MRSLSWQGSLVAAIAAFMMAGCAAAPVPPAPPSMLSPAPTSAGSQPLSPIPAFVFTLERPQPLPVRVFDRTGRLIGARESTPAESSNIPIPTTPMLRAGRSPDTRIAAWVGGSCDDSADLIVGPAVNQLTVEITQRPLPSPTNGVEFACDAVGLARYVTLAFAPLASAGDTPTVTTTFLQFGRNRIPLEVHDQSGWLLDATDASGSQLPDSRIFQGPTSEQLYVRLEVCSLATEIRITIGPDVAFIIVDATYPWPSDAPAPACPGLPGAAVLLTFDRPVVPPP